MIFFLYGEDSYRSRQKLNEIVENHKKAQKGGLSLKYFEGRNLNYQDFRDELQTASLFAQKKLLILWDVLSNKGFGENFLKESKKFISSQDIILFYQEREFLKDNFFNFLKKNAKFQEFELLENQELKKWIKKEFEKYQTPHHPALFPKRAGGAGQAKIELKALELLIGYVGNDLWQLSNEIQKLVSYKEGKEISIQDIELLVKPKIETNIFKTIDALAEKNKKQALKLLHSHLEKGDSPFYLLSMINYQFRNILGVKDLIERKNSYQEILVQTKLHPYVFKKTYYLAQKFTLEELKKIYQKIFQADLNIKTGRIGPETALDLLIAGI